MPIILHLFDDLKKYQLENIINELFVIVLVSTKIYIFSRGNIASRLAENLQLQANSSFLR